MPNAVGTLWVRCPPTTTATRTSTVCVARDIPPFPPLPASPCVHASTQPELLAVIQELLYSTSGALCNLSRHPGNRDLMYRLELEVKGRAALTDAAAKATRAVPKIPGLADIDAAAMLLSGQLRTDGPAAGEGEDGSDGADGSILGFDGASGAAVGGGRPAVRVPLYMRREVESYVGFASFLQVCGAWLGGEGGGRALGRVRVCLLTGAQWLLTWLFAQAACIREHYAVSGIMARRDSAEHGHEAADCSTVLTRPTALRTPSPPPPPAPPYASRRSCRSRCTCRPDRGRAAAPRAAARRGTMTRAKPAA